MSPEENMARTKFAALLFGCSLWSTSALADEVQGGTADSSPPRSQQPLAVLLLDAGSYSEECLKPEDLAGAVEAQIGSQTFVENGDPRASLTIRVAIRKIASPPGWQARVRTQTTDGRVWGERQLEVGGQDCHALNEQLVLITTLMADPSFAPSARESEHAKGTADDQRAAAPIVPREDVPVADVGTVSVAPEAPERHWETSVEGALVGALGVLPAVAPGARIRLRIAPPWFWTTRLSATAYYPQEIEVLDGSARFGLALAGIDFCPVPRSPGDNMSAILCAGANVGILSVESFDLADVRSVRRWVVEGFVAVGLMAPIFRNWYAGGELTLGIPARRDTFAYTTIDGERRPLFEQGAVSVAFSALIGHTL